MAELDDSHVWTEKTIDGDVVPVCIDCKAEGYEDEPDGFLPCPGKPSKGCDRTMKSSYMPGHTHRCVSDHTTGDHICECGRRFGKR